MSKTIQVTAREEHGTGAARRARLNGNVPVVLYGKGVESRNLYATVGALDAAQPKKGDEVTLVVDGKEVAAVVGEVQINYLKSHILHVDFVVKA